MAKTTLRHLAYHQRVRDHEAIMVTVVHVRNMLSLLHNKIPSAAPADTGCDIAWMDWLKTAERNLEMLEHDLADNEP